MWKKRQADAIPSIVKSIKLWCAAEIQLHISFFFTFRSNQYRKGEEEKNKQ